VTLIERSDRRVVDSGFRRNDTLTPSAVAARRAVSILETLQPTNESDKVRAVRIAKGQLQGLELQQSFAQCRNLSRNATIDSLVAGKSAEAKAQPQIIDKEQPMSLVE
jgi:hypothetical protein